MAAGSMTPSAQDAPNTQDAVARAGTGRGVLFRTVGFAVVIVAAALNLPIAIARFQHLRAPTSAVRADLARLGISTDAYAAFQTALNVVFATGCLLVAALVVRHARNHRMALVVASFLALLGTSNAPNVQAIGARYPGWEFLAEVALFALWFALTGFLCLFPDGRFEPRLSRILLPAWGGTLAICVVLSGDTLAGPSSIWVGATILSGLVAGVAAQIWRYVRASGPVERQQTKWVVVGAAAAILVQLLTAIVTGDALALDRYGTAYDMAELTVVTTGYFLIPASVGIAVLRYRLWDIDVIVNRGLVYGTLSVAVVGLYALLVAGAGTLLEARGNPLLALLAAGIVAILFQPLRVRLQRGVNRLMYGERDDPLAVISQLGRRLESTLAPDAVLPEIVTMIRDALKLPYVAVALDQDGEAPIVVAAGRPETIALRLPLVFQGERFGELQLAPRAAGEAFSQFDRRLLQDLARQAGVAAHGVRLTIALQRSREQLVAAREEERRRLRRDLHDGLGPVMAGLTLKLETARNLLAHDPAAATLLAEMVIHTQSAVKDIRRLTHELRPPALDELGLVSALREQATAYSSSDLLVNVSAPEPLPPLPAAIEVAAFRIALEAMTNAVRHGCATVCDVRLYVVDDRALHLEIIDNGKGIPTAVRRGVGLFSMRERAEELGGTFDVGRRPDQRGTVVHAYLPLRRGAT